jgi:hypothetical protein
VLGDATRTAAIGMYGRSPQWAELVQTYILFGDPALQIGIGANPPRILRTLPTAGAKDVAVDQPIQLFFSKDINVSTFSMIGSASTPFTATWSNNDTVVTLDHKPFLAGTVYNFTVTAKDEGGTGFGPDELVFTTAFDFPPSGIIRPEPGNVLVITFNEPVITATVQYAITPKLNGHLEWRSNTEAVFHHDPFPDGQLKYIFSILYVEDLIGNPRRNCPKMIFNVTDGAITILTVCSGRTYLPIVSK